jgi:hypothetical protein
MDTIAPVFRSGYRVSFRDDWAVLYQSFKFYNHFFDMKKILLLIVMDAHKAIPPKIVGRHRQTSATGGPLKVRLAQRLNVGAWATRSMSAAHHVPTLAMVHPTEHLLAPMFAAVVTDDQRCDNCEYE